ncbi:MAG: Uncharacterised protein [Owenweeksia sp. TMED14]|nr:MAG: Uncharacterised protein [Owenweeksia sp. TMED14]
MKKIPFNKNRSFWRSVSLSHRFYQISGGYKFLVEGFRKLGLVLILFAAAIWLVNTYLFNIEAIASWVTIQFHWTAVIILLGFSEIVTGILPPDFFILWAGEMEHPYLMVFLLSAVSYSSGVLSYLIGRRINNFPMIQRWIKNRFEEQSRQIKKFGGLLIFLSAMTPLPFPPICTIAGIVNFRFQWFLILAIARFFRFFLYAIFIFGLT